LIIHTLAATLSRVAIPYVVIVLLPAVALPARYKLTPDPCAIVILPEPRFTMLIAVPTDHDTDVLLAMVRVLAVAKVE
jgi:hypothetical protein